MFPSLLQKVFKGQFGWILNFCFFLVPLKYFSKQTTASCVMESFLLQKFMSVDINIREQQHLLLTNVAAFFWLEEKKRLEFPIIKNP